MLGKYVSPYVHMMLGFSSLWLDGERTVDGKTFWKGRVSLEEASILIV